MGRSASIVSTVRSTRGRQTSSTCELRLALSIRPLGVDLCLDKTPWATGRIRLGEELNVMVVAPRFNRMNKTKNKRRKEFRM